MCVDQAATVQVGPGHMTGADGGSPTKLELLLHQGWHRDGRGLSARVAGVKRGVLGHRDRTEGFHCPTGSLEIMSGIATGQSKDPPGRSP
uniref:Uncharacterized protein n=1 Tax=Knipowitschia caucasica TaxID=637954 RepID=A0AAV2L0K4_KNICA